MDWIDIKIEKPPIGRPIIITDGVTMCTAEMDKGGSFGSYGFIGPEWEFEFEEEDITHWRLAPPLPVKNKM